MKQAANIFGSTGTDSISTVALQYLLLKGARQRSNSDTVDRRFKSITFWSSTELSVTELKLADTALYYCALRDVRAQ